MLSWDEGESIPRFQRECFWRKADRPLVKGRDVAGGKRVARQVQTQPQGAFGMDQEIRRAKQMGSISLWRKGTMELTCLCKIHIVKD